MRRLSSPLLLSLALTALVVNGACEASKSSNPLSPTVAGPIPGVEITPPKLLEPQQGFRFKESQQPIRLLIENASTSGVRPLAYVFEVASDREFGTIVFARSGVPPGEGGRTSVQVDRLASGRSYFWRARAQDGANTGVFASAQFEVLPNPVLRSPSPVSPVNNEQVTSRRPALRVRNADRNAAVGPVHYVFMVARDQAFGQLVSAANAGEGDGETSWTPDVDLDFGVTLFWRVRATDGDTSSAWTATQVFRTPGAPAPGPAPGPPSPPPPTGGPCVSGDPENIVECERRKFGRMSSSQIVTFLRQVARSLNTNNISGRPFGILRKGGGHNCNGYSCDIICSGQGSSQSQWDVLADAEGSQTPTWNGPKRAPNIRVDVCEIQ